MRGVKEGELCVNTLRSKCCVVGSKQVSRRFEFLLQGVCFEEVYLLVSILVIVDSCCCCPVDVGLLPNHVYLCVLSLSVASILVL